ncbi:MAG: energy-coupling factor transporter transmembrane component T family protein [Candidatus Polarisedimenticolia bacterium]
MSGELAWLHREGASWLHRLDPAAKILALALCFALAWMAWHPITLGALAAALVAGFVSTRTLGVLRRFGVFLLVLFLVTALLWSLFSTEPSGWSKGLRQGARLVLMLATGLLFLAATRVEEIAAGLRRLGLPFPVAFSLSLAFRLLPLLASRAHAIVEAQACRGLDPREGSLPARLRSGFPLVIPLVLSSLRSAAGLAAALESRGLGMHPRRTSVIEGKVGPAEIGAVALPAVLAGILCFLRMKGLVL